MALIQNLCRVGALLVALGGGVVHAQTLGVVEQRLNRLEDAVRHLQRHTPLNDEISPPPLDRTSAGMLVLQNRLDAMEKMLASVSSAQEQGRRDTAVALDQLQRFRADSEGRLAGLDEKLATLAVVPKAEPIIAQPKALTVDDRYLEALGFAQKGEWAKSEFAFDTFIVNNPSFPRLTEARYWLGRSFMGEGKPAAAAKIFLEIYEKYPDAPVMVDNLFALAEALTALGPDSTKQACAVYDQIGGDFKDRLGTVQRNALLDKRVKLGCVN